MDAFESDGQLAAGNWALAFEKAIDSSCSLLLSATVLMPHSFASLPYKKGTETSILACKTSGMGQYYGVRELEELQDHPVQPLAKYKQSTIITFLKGGY